MEDKDRAREFQANHSRFLLFSTLRQFLLFSTLSLLRQQSGKLFLIVGGGNSSLGSAFCLGHSLFLTLHWDTTWDTTCLGLNNQLQLFCFKPPKDCTSTRLEGRFQKIQQKHVQLQKIVEKQTLSSSSSLKGSKGCD